MSDQTSGRQSERTAAPVGRPLLSLTLAAIMDDVGAHSGAVYLLAPGEQVLEMAVMAGLPRAFAAPWERVGLSAPVPVAKAVRERRLVWVGGEEDMARAIRGSPSSCRIRSRWPRCRWRPSVPCTGPSS